jgi:cyclophilin family peptidyl-prolyl cis-trans isomerase
MRNWRRIPVICGGVFCLLGPFADAEAPGGAPEPAAPVAPITEVLRREFQLAPFYSKALMVGALPVVGSTNVSDAAMREAAWLVRHMLDGREDILGAMATNKTRLAVMAWMEFTTDIPEHAHLDPKVYWDRRARGLGATPRAPAVSCAEENLLCFPGDPYSTENICIHEFAHAIHEMGLSRIDPSFDGRLREAYQGATNRGLWKATYAGSNYHEYWAEATQSWFDNNRANDALHNDIDTRAKLKPYDPGVAKLCTEVYGDHEWRYHKPLERTPADRAHLAGFDFASSPRFQWREPPIPERPLVRIETPFGRIEVELDAVKAPVTTRNFLRYAHAGLYFDGRFFRTVTPHNQPTNTVKIAVIQAQANPAKTNAFLPPIPLERTRDTGLKHLDGTISMARDGPDTAQDEFFICVGDQPELDFGGKRNPDGQGFAAFGRVVKGMDVVRQIHAQPAEGQLLKSPLKIQGAMRLN